MSRQLLGRRHVRGNGEEGEEVAWQEEKMKDLLIHGRLRKKPPLEGCGGGSQKNYSFFLCSVLFVTVPNQKQTAQ